MSEHLDRLNAMLDHRQQTWDLSPNDIAAIRWAVAEIERLRKELTAAQVALLREGVARDECRRLLRDVAEWIELTGAAWGGGEAKRLLEAAKAAGGGDG